jgi:YggT family protein
MQALIYVLDTVLSLFVLAVLTRFYAQALRAPFRNPIADFVVSLTDFAVKPMRKVIPSAMGLDTASLLVAWIAEIVLQVVIYALVSPQALLSPGFWPTILILALFKLLKLSIYLLMGVVIIQAVLSWFSPYHPIRPFFDALSRPFLRPIQRIVPLVGNVDLSPLVLWIALQVLLMGPMAWLETEAGKVMLRMFGA